MTGTNDFTQVINKDDNYTYMTIVFNDFMFEDGWAEPYIVQIKLKTEQPPQLIAERLKGIAIGLYNSEDGLECSYSGIEQILDKYKELVHPELEYHISGCASVPFGDVEKFD